MRAGRLDRRVAIQRKTVVLHDDGSAVETWSTIATRWASVNPVSAAERFSVPQIGATQETEFQVRYSEDIADLSPLDRLVYPIPTGSPEVIPDTSVFDIAAVHEIGRRDGLRIIAIRRNDT
jgi:head-tail adaptor